MTDADYLLSVLSDGEWHSRDEINERSRRQRGFGFTVHSRAPDLRKRGHIIDCHTRRTTEGRVQSFYRLVALKEAAAPPRLAAASLSASSPGESTAGAPIVREGALVLFDTPRGAYGGEQ